MDVVGIKNDIATPQGLVLYEAQLSICKVIVGVSGGCLVATTIVLLIFYVKTTLTVTKRAGDSEGAGLFQPSDCKALLGVRINGSLRFCPWLSGCILLYAHLL